MNINQWLDEMHEIERRRMKKGKSYPTCPKRIKTALRGCEMPYWMLKAMWEGDKKVYQEERLKYRFFIAVDWVLIGCLVCLIILY